MKYRKCFILLYVFLALPIPVSLITWLGTIISLANIGMVDWFDFKQLTQAIIAMVAMLSAGLYPVTYAISLFIIKKNQRLTKISFLPVVHIILVIILLFVWSWSNRTFKI